MTWLIEDEAGDVHEILEDERVLVLAQNSYCAQAWLREEGLPPYGRQFVVSPSPRALGGGRWPVIVEVSCFYRNRDAFAIERALAHTVGRMPTPPRTIQVACR